MSYGSNRAEARHDLGRPSLALLALGGCALGLSAFLVTSSAPTAQWTSAPSTVRPPSLTLATQSAPRPQGLPLPTRVTLTGAPAASSPLALYTNALQPPSQSPPAHWALTGLAALTALLGAVLLWRPPRVSAPMAPAFHMAALAEEGAGKGGGGKEEKIPAPEAYGYDSIRWLPPFDLAMADEEAAEGEMVLPLFPLQHAVHLPGSSHILNIFEPRYCEMYSTIILNGSRRFVVPLTQPTPAWALPTGLHLLSTPKMSIAEVGAVFYVEDFSKVEEETDGVIKYVCQHKVIGRVRIKRILNPRHMLDRTTYLRGVVEDLEDENTSADYSEQEAKVSDSFREVVNLHTRLGEFEPVRFSADIAKLGNLATPGTDGTFWKTASLWHSLLQERLAALRITKTVAEQTLVRLYLKEQGVNLEDLLGKNDSAKVGIRLTDLPDDLQKQYLKLQKDFEEESRPFANTLLWFFQSVAQEQDHGRRLRMFQPLIEKELSRMRAKASLQALFDDKK